MVKFGRIKFKDDELLNDLETTVSVVKQVGSTHLGLGLRVGFLEAINLAYLGCLQVGTMGIGKTKSLEAIQRAMERFLGYQLTAVKKKKKVFKERVPGKNSRKYKWIVFTEEFTLASVNDRINSAFTDSRVTWISKDLAKLSTIVQENMLKVASSVISDHECMVTTSMYGCNIQNSYVSWLGACTYEIFNNLLASSLWRGMYQDRIMRYHAFQYRLAEVNTSTPRFDVKLDVPTKLPQFGGENISAPEVDKDKWYKRVVDMLEMQFTYERSVEYAERLLQAMAMLNYRDYTVPADAKFLLLHEFNIGAESHIAWRDTISSPLNIDTDILLILSEAVKRGGVGVSFLANKYHTDEEELRDSVVEYDTLVTLEDGGNMIQPTKLVMNALIAQNSFEEWTQENG